MGHKIVSANEHFITLAIKQIQQKNIPLFQLGGGFSYVTYNELFDHHPVMADYLCELTQAHPLKGVCPGYKIISVCAYNIPGDETNNFRFAHSRWSFCNEYDIILIIAY